MNIINGHAPWITIGRALSVWLCLFGLTGIVQAQIATQVTVNAGSTLATYTPMSLGVNTAVWDAHLTDPGVAELIRGAGLTILRYPGGSTSDVYHWKTNTDTGDTHFNSASAFDPFMKLAHDAGASVIVTVNYGSNASGTAGGDPAEAAAWVNYANNVKHYNVKYWEIGNEIYGNGFYNGSGWEEDLHAPSQPASARKNNPELSPDAYGRNVALFSAAMKAADPSVKIGVVLTTPTQWPDNVAPSWNQGTLAACGKSIDFAIIHYYPQNPGQESDSGLLASSHQVAPAMAALRPILEKYCGRQIPVFLTETNSVSSNPGKQTISTVNALYAADDYLTWLSNGVANVDWWGLFNGPTSGSNDSASLFGNATYGDYGILATGGGPEPPLNTRLPSYFGIQMVRSLFGPGDRLVEATSDQPLVAVHAVHRAGGGIGLMLIDEDPSRAATVQVSVSGAKVGASGTRLDYGPDGVGQQTTLSQLGSSFTVTVPAYTVTDIVIR